MSLRSILFTASLLATVAVAAPRAASAQTAEGPAAPVEGPAAPPTGPVRPPLEAAPESPAPAPQDYDLGEDHRGSLGGMLGAETESLDGASEDPPDHAPPPPPAPTVVGFLPAPSTPAGPMYRDAGAPTTRKKWYGWQIMASDAASLAVGAVAPQLTLAGYALGPALLHFHHGNTGRGVASVGMRLGFPYLGAAIALANCDTSGSQDDHDWLGPEFGCMMGGAALGIVTAMVVDWSIATKSVKVDAPPRWNLGMAPRLDGGMTLSFGGKF